jgi:hypothetical protein
VDLDELDHEVSGRASAWRAADARWDIIRWPVTDKPAASLRVEKADAAAELILWVSGEAELTYTRDSLGEPVSEHYEITTALGLLSRNKCVESGSCWTR